MAKDTNTKLKERWQLRKSICSIYDKVLISLKYSDSCKWIKHKKSNGRIGAQDDPAILR